MVRLSSGLLVLLTLASLSTIGCSGRPGRVEAPEVDADAAADAAMSEFDKNTDGQLSADELKAAPGLAAAVPNYDADKNGSLSRDEVAAGIRTFSEGQVGAAGMSYVVQLDGRPVPNAQVKAIPEPFLGEVLKPATGVDGYLAVAKEDRPPNSPNLPLIMPGLYRIEITHPSLSIPARYNEQSELGLEVSSNTISNSAQLWDLKSR
jgi:hypothetical protein